MDALTFTLVLTAAVFHASWNFATKKSAGNRTAVLWLGQVYSGVLCFPIALLLSDLTPMTTMWLWILLASSVVHAVYVLLLGWAYDVGDMSVVYPIARGVGIGGTCVLALTLGIDKISATGAAGILATIVGSSVVGLSQRQRLGSRRAVIAAFSVGLAISVYSLIDKIAAAQIPPFLFVTAINIVSPTLLLPFMWRRYREGVVDAWKNRKAVTFFVGMAGCAPYTLILWAYHHTPASYVVALRETAVVIGAGLGIVVLKEHVSPLKLAGIVAIAAGAVLIRLA